MVQLAVRNDEDAKSPPRASRLQADLAARILRMLKEQGAGPGHHRGYVLRGPVTQAPDIEVANPEDEEDHRLFIAIAEARNQGRLPDQCSQLEVARLFDAKLPTVVRVLRQLAELGLVERKPGNGWSFSLPINSGRARLDSYAFRSVIEPAGLVEATFELDREWMDRSRAAHLAFRKRKWRDTLSVELFALNADFHEQLARCSGNRYFLDAVQRQNKLRSFMNIQWVNGAGRVVDSIDEHLAIMDALDGGDNRLAHELMKSHLDKARSVEATV
jgi:DNA-binding GntR family transcriptional regulator